MKTHRSGQLTPIRSSDVSRRVVLARLGAGGLAAAAGGLGAAAVRAQVPGDSTPGASPGAADPLSVLAAWVEGHRAAKHDPNLLAPDAVLAAAGLPPIAGADNIVAFLDAFYGAVGDRVITVETSIASGDEVAGLLRLQGTHAGPLLGVPATGNPVDIWVAAFDVVRDGRFERIRAVFDAASLMVQIGVAAAPGAQADATPAV